MIERTTAQLFSVESGIAYRNQSVFVTGSSPESPETAAIEGAVASNLEVLIRKLKDLPFDKD
jgi:hypothetical protein